MQDFIASGQIANVILAAMAVEILVFGYVLWRRNQGFGLLSFLASSLSGASLVLALRAALQDAGWLYVAIYLAASLLAHLAEMAIRIHITRN